MARSIDELAVRAHRLYHPPDADQAQYVIWIEDGFREFVHECGGVYTVPEEIILVDATREYALPTRLRKIKPAGVYLYYAPRTIAAVGIPGLVRALQNVTITTTAAHYVAVGMEITIAGVTESGTSFGVTGDFTIETVPNATQFTYADARDAAIGGGGTVALTDGDEVMLDLLDETEQVDSAGWQTTEGAVSGYWFPDSLHIAFYPVPDGTDPIAVIRYDADAPTSITTSADLPVADWCEKGLIGYGKLQAALMVGDDRAAGLGLSDYEQMKARWRTAQIDRKQTDSRDADLVTRRTVYNYRDEIQPSSSRGTW